MLKKLPHKYKKTENNIHTLLVDGSSLFKVAYHGAKNEYNYKGEHIGGIYQFMTSLRKLLNENLYHKVFVFWDGKFSGKLRYEIYKDYKSGRGKNYETGTIPDDENQLLERFIIQEYLEELFIKQLEDEIVEGDDFIATYCKTKEPNEIITICSGDSDLCQLIDENIRVYSLSKKVYIDKNNYSEYYNHHLENCALIKTITGDSSDSIKGIKGVKETTLLNNFPELKERPLTIENIIEKAKEIQLDRLTNKKSRLLALDNIVNAVTDGIQGKDIYEINNKLVNLKSPFLTEEALDNFNYLRNGKLSEENRGIKNLWLLMQRDGLDNKIGNGYEEYLMPFKKLIEREKKNIYE